MFAVIKVPGKVPPARIVERLKPSGAIFALTMGRSTKTSAARTEHSKSANCTTVEESIETIFLCGEW